MASQRKTLNNFEIDGWGELGPCVRPRLSVNQRENATNCGQGCAVAGERDDAGCRIPLVVSET